MLAVLLLAGGRPVPADTLIDRVWGEAPPAEVRQSLQADIYRLRRMLKASGVSDHARITAVPGAYALEVDPEHVDVFRSRSLREQAASIRRSGNLRTAAELLHEALSLWRSEPLTGLSGEWFDHMRASLDGDYRAMAQELVDIELAAGKHAETIGFLVELTGRYPLDETFVGQLMLAYYRCGRQTDSIELYRTTARLLRDGAGADPSPWLQTRYRDILRHDPSVAAPRSATSEGTPGAGRLPAPVAEFTGRAAELAELSGGAGALGGVIVIEGMAGVGKSALAVKLVHRAREHFPDGCVYLHLHAHDPQRPAITPGAALAELLRAAGIPPTRLPREVADRARLWRESMEGRRALILLDDAADSGQVRALLPGNPDCHVIITSRRRLTGIPGARHHRLGVLPAGDGAELFTRLAGPATEHPPAAVADAVRLCGGLPLAIGLAATRLRDRQVSSIDALIEELSGPYEDIAGLRDPALAATFELSFRDLSPTRRRVFRRLGLSPAAELTAPVVAVLADIPADEAERSLADFADHHLVEEIFPGRFRLHDLLRQYALARANSDESAVDRRRAVGRTLDHYLARADLADRRLYPHQARAAITAVERSLPVDGFEDERSATEWLESERKNLFDLVRYAADHEWHAHVIDYAGTLARFLDSASEWEEAEAIQHHALKVALSLELPQAVARVRTDLSVVQWRVGRVREALANATEAREIGRRSAAPEIEAVALDQIGLIKWSSSDYRQALAYFGEALDLYRAAGDVHGAADCLGHIGMVLGQTGRHQEALESFHEALELTQVVGDKRREATTLSNLANTYLLLGYHRHADELFRKSHDIYRTLTGRRNMAILRNNFGDVARYRGKLDAALRSYREALAEFSAMGDRINESNSLNNIGVTLSQMEKYNEALIHHKMAMSVAEEIGNIGEKIRAELGFADTDIGMGRYRAAADRYRSACEQARNIGDPYLEAQALCGIARVTGLTEGNDAARIFWRQAYDLFRQMGVVPEMEAVRVRLEIIGLADS